MKTYDDFLLNKAQIGGSSGFNPLWIPDFLFDFQKSLVEWNISKGRSATFADCGLGKTPMQLVWCDNVFRKTEKPVLILTPLAVSGQTKREADKFGIDAVVSREGKPGKRITITNYERLHYFNPNDFSGCVCDESAAIKNFDAKRTADITEFMRKMEYRHLCTATAAPNDFIELGTSSQALGYLGFTEVITRFFKEEVSKDHLGWGRKSYRFRGHAETPFWKWVCSWARACRTPSDLGFDSSRFVLPELIEREEIVKSASLRDGMMFALPAMDIREQREERRITINERCEAAAKNATDHDGSTVIWCHLNPEGDLIEKLTPDCKQVSGSQSDDEKEEILTAFSEGKIKRLVTKPVIGAWGLNWQHCHNIVSFPSHSFEQHYQSVRRCWRFGQKNSVTSTIISTQGEARVLSSLQRKARQANEMFASLVRYMNEAVQVDSSIKLESTGSLPTWA